MSDTLRGRGEEPLETCSNPWHPANLKLPALSVTSDGYVTTESDFFGEAADLDRNLLNLLIAADLTPEERAEFERRYRERVDD